MQYKCVACCVKCSMFSFRCRDAVSGAFAGAGTVCNVHYAVCRVSPAKHVNLSVKTG